MNQSQPPYRPPCGGTVLCSNGPRYRHGGKPAEMNIPVFLYDTQVCDWHWSDCPNGCTVYADCSDGMILPYERYAYPTSGPCNSPCETGGSCPDPPCQPCGPWDYNALNPAPTPSFYQPQMLTAVTIANGGSGYHVGDLLGASGGTTSSYVSPNGITNDLNITVTAVNGSGAITAIKITQAGSFQNTPSSPNSVIGGHGTGAQINFTFSNQTENLSPCFKYGFKNVQARRQWHGQPGFYFNNPQALYSCSDNCPDYNWFTPYSLSATQSKYTTVTGTATGSNTLYDGDGNPIRTLSGTITVDLSIDPLSGVITNGSSLSGSPDQCCATWGGQFNFPFAWDAFGMMWSTPQEWWDYFWSYWDGADSGGDTLTCGDGSFSDYDPDTGITNFDLTWSVTDTSLSMYATVNEGLYTLSLALTDSSVHFNFSMPGPVPGSYSFDTTLDISLGGSNTAADVQEDIVTLLDEWDLTNDAEYPWRTDQYTTIAPLVTRNEAPGNIALSSFTIFTICGAGSDACPDSGDCPEDTCAKCGGGDTPCLALTNADGYQMVATTDPNASLYDGSVVGAPLPAGYQGCFDFNYVNWQYCADSDPPSFYIHGYGGYVSSTGAALPQNATQWTDNATACQFPSGAWIFYNHNPSWTACNGSGASEYNFTPGAYCMAQKWAETKMGFPSQNFARPAGDDKFAFDETNVFTINSKNTTNGVTTVHLLVPYDCANANTAPGLGSGIWGGSSVNGFFEVTGNGSPFTLGTKIFNLPGNWDSQSGTFNANANAWQSDANAAFGLLRWPNEPAILGLAGVESVSNANGNSQLSTISLPTLAMGVSNANADHVDLYDKNLNLLAANAAVTRVDDSHFKVPVAFSTAQNTAYIASNGAAPHYWNDNFPKGDYAYTDWIWWPRLVCEAARINNLFESCANANCGNAVTSNCNCSAINCEPVYCNPFFDAGSNSFVNAFTQEAGCLPFNPCNPSVICISPNEESFPVGTTWPFKTIQFDEQYGSGWQAEPQQVMQDLLYQTPHYPAIAPCTPNPFAWLEDDGTCNEGSGTVQYYPHAPMVECRITLPNNGGPDSNSAAPALPNGITIGWESPAGTYTNCGSQPANILFPPNSVGFGLQAFTTWTLWNNECNCIDGEGVFAADYSEDVLGCQ